jgi:hypothetical protein
MTPFSRHAAPGQYEPPPVWEDTARELVSLFLGEREPTHAVAAEAEVEAEGFGFVLDGREIRAAWSWTQEEAARVAASARLLKLPAWQVVERAIATQWYLDKHMSTGLELVLHGQGRFRRAVRLPRTAMGVAS